jgi:oligopeptide transport system substrate-binding protein
MLRSLGHHGSGEAQTPSGLCLSFLSLRGRVFFLLMLLVALQTQAAPLGRSSRDNVLRLARANEPPNLDAHLALSLGDWMIVYLLHQTLVDTERYTNNFPLACIQWTMPEDSRSFECSLKPGVRFSDGTPVTAADYASSLERIAKPETASWMNMYLTEIRGYDRFITGQSNHMEGVQALAPDRLRIELNSPDPVFPIWLLAVGMAVRETRVADPAINGGTPTAVLGTGPYRLKEWRRGIKIVLEQNPYYLGPVSNRFDRIEFLIGGNDVTQLMMFERGELDIANVDGGGVPFAHLSRIAHDPKWGRLLETIPGVNATFVTINVEIPPFNDVRVRRALNHAVNKPRRMFTRLRQFEVARGVLPPTVPGYDPALRGYAHDPAKARHLIAESGVKLPVRTQLWHNDDPMNRLIAAGIQEDLKQVGIEAELRTASWVAMTALALQRGKMSLRLDEWNPMADPKDFILARFDGRTLTNSSHLNMSFYDSPQVNALIDAAGLTSDRKERLALFLKAEKIIVEDAPWIFLAHKNQFLLRQPWIKGDLIDPSGIHRLERAWMER